MARIPILYNVLLQDYRFRKRQTVIKLEASWRILNAFFCAIIQRLYVHTGKSYSNGIDCTPEYVTENRNKRKSSGDCVKI